ncbi:MAG: argininosuccinate lyase [Spirochaeta sp.]|nr:argininosuccinate lyase [Spirochaeta sp.]
MAKLWDKNYDLDALIERFTVGTDYILDLKLLPADCVASAAHATMLASAGIISAKDKELLLAELGALLKDFDAGEFVILPEHEDGHTALEERLIARLGDVGKKIHTGRSRNDQVLTAQRLYSRGLLCAVAEAVCSLVEVLLEYGRTHALTPMPGRTHMQPAMPSSVGLWAMAFAEQLLDTCELLDTAYRLNDQSPLGAAASYGVPLPLDRELTARLLGFSKVQTNVLYANNSRGVMESIVLDSFEQLGLCLGKLASDCITFSLPEFGYFSIPDRLCSGSSIMPQKKNPDGLELVRAKTAALSGQAQSVKNVIRNLPSGYNRDFQETKAPLIHGGRTILDCLSVTQLTMEELKINKDALVAGFGPDIYATDKAIELVQGGMSFRDAYRKVAAEIDQMEDRSPAESLLSRRHLGTPNNLDVDGSAVRLSAYRSTIAARVAVLHSLGPNLLGHEVAIFRS